MALTNFMLAKTPRIPLEIKQNKTYFAFIYKRKYNKKISHSTRQINNSLTQVDKRDLLEGSLDSENAILI